MGGTGMSERLRVMLSDILANRLGSGDDALYLETAADQIAALGPSYAVHARLFRPAIWQKFEAEATIAGQLTKVLEKLEQGVS
jgi:hypothetical protein